LAKENTISRALESEIPKGKLKKLTYNIFKFDIN
jgi:hypothetical protein